MAISRVFKVSLRCSLNKIMDTFVHSYSHVIHLGFIMICAQNIVWVYLRSLQRILL